MIEVAAGLTFVDAEAPRSRSDYQVADHGRILEHEYDGYAGSRIKIPDAGYHLAPRLREEQRVGRLSTCRPTDTGTSLWAESMRSLADIVHLGNAQGLPRMHRQVVFVAAPLGRPGTGRTGSHSCRIPGQTVVVTGAEIAV